MSGGPDPASFRRMQTHAHAIQQENATALEQAREEIFTEAQWITVERYVQSLSPAGRGGGPARGGGFPG